MKVPLLVTQFLDRAARIYGNKTAVIQEEKSVTYNEVNERVNQLSHGLRSLGVKKGDRVAYLAPNTLEMYEGFYGTARVGAIMVPLNSRLTPEDYRYILNHSESKVLFVDAMLYDNIAGIVDELETVEHVIIHRHDGQEYPHRLYDEWRSQFSAAPVASPALQEDDVCSLLYTSGTTGKPKGVMLTHRNNYLHALTTMHHLRISDRDTLMHVLPMFHVNGWGSPYSYTANGATQVMLPKVDPETMISLIQQYGVTVMHMAPTVLNALLEMIEKEQPQLPRDVRLVIAGSAPPPSFVARVEEELGWEFLQVYGMTESSPLSLVSYIPVHERYRSKDEHYAMKAKAGFEIIGNEVRVVDDHGEPVAQNNKDIGEIIVRSNGVMKGYWKNEDETMATIRDGWLHTGDMGVMDERGAIEIVDRKKDIIISGGENISSIEVEGALYEHPAVQEAAIVAMPHEKWGETPHAFVVVREGQQASEEELIDFLRERLAHFKCPKSMSFIDELPKTASGKIQKVQLRESCWTSRDRKVN